ncbi:hypothetical protein PEC301877_40530 [Pectobacterium carotovorum subsp. carotovorum]|nr:hypothetical protein PEC301877_40530 [Pectobacterium carotovorum subsp. carotovorum]
MSLSIFKLNNILVLFFFIFMSIVHTLFYHIAVQLASL